MLQMASLLRESGARQGAGSLGGMGGARTAFPAPGNPSTGSQTSPTNTAPANTQAASQPGAAPVNPFAAFFPPSATAASPGAFNPFEGNPALQQMLGFGTGAGGLAGAFGTPADTRPPEERFQTQLQVSLTC
jgi:ubiquilin